MKTIELDLFQREGLLSMVQNELDEMHDTRKIRDLICGTRDNNLINLQNTIIDVLIVEPHYPKLGAIGISKSHDLIFQYWDRTENEHINVMIPTSVFRVSWNWKQDAKIIEKLNADLE